MRIGGVGGHFYMSVPRVLLSYDPSMLVPTYNVKELNEKPLKQPIIPTAVQRCSSSQALLVFTGKQFCHGGQLRSQKINIHRVPVTLCEYLSQNEASRDREPCNQYLLVLPSEELDFTIRSACSPDSTSNFISRLDMSGTDVAA